MKRFIGKIGYEISDYVESRLRKFCFGMSRDTRVIMVVCIVIVSTFVSLFVFATAVYQAGKYKGREEMQIEHITAPDVIKADQRNNLKIESDEKE